MGKGKSNTKNLLGLFAFFAIIVKASAYILSYLNVGLGIITFVADIILTVIALVVAWSYAKSCSKIWRIIYIIILILVIVGFAFGGFNL